MIDSWDAFNTKFLINKFADLLEDEVLLNNEDVLQKVISSFSGEGPFSCLRFTPPVHMTDEGLIRLNLSEAAAELRKMAIRVDTHLQSQ